jgi:hypothetical protein
MNAFRPFSIFENAFKGGAFGVPEDSFVGPLDLSPSAWWDASQEEGLSNNDPVNTITDFSGNGLHASALTTARPTYQVNQINGLPVFNFDGVDDKAVFGILTVQEAYIVCNYLGGASFSTFNGAFTFSSATSIFRGDATTNDWRSNGVGGDGIFGSNMFVNGAQTKDLGDLSDFSLSHGFADSPISLAGEIGHDVGDEGRFWNGKIAEILCFSESLSAGNRALVKAYFSSKYNLTIA